MTTVARRSTGSMMSELLDWLDQGSPSGVRGLGLAPYVRVEDYTEDEVDEILGVNLKAAYWGCVLAARQMTAQNSGGSIVNVTSQAGILGSKDRAPYSAAKAGLINFAQ